MKKRFTEEQIIGFLREAGAGMPVAELCRKHAFSEADGRFRDECLNEHWFTSMRHTQVIIEAWRREYNEERPKKSLGWMTPTAYARSLAQKSIKLTSDFKAPCY